MVRRVSSAGVRVAGPRGAAVEQVLRRALELYRQCVAVLYGVSAINVHSNRSKLEIAIDGFDFMEALP